MATAPIYGLQVVNGAITLVPIPASTAGPAGPKGATGAQGPAGPQGPKGDKGDAGGVVTPPPVDPPPVDPPPTTGTSVYFLPTSTWNTKVPANATFTDVPAAHGKWWLNAGDYGTPLVVSKAGDPPVTIAAPSSWGRPATALTVRIPAAVTGAVGTDGTLIVLDADLAYSFWQFRRNGNTANVAAWAVANVKTEDGWGKGSVGAGIRATGSSCLAGLLTGPELKSVNGIQHALALTARFDLAGGKTGQAINSDGGSGPLLEGARYAIPPGVARPSSITTIPGIAVFNAMQQFGGFFVDSAGGDVAVTLVSDPRTVDDADAVTLLGGPTAWNAPELTVIGSLVKRVG